MEDFININQIKFRLLLTNDYLKTFEKQFVFFYKQINENLFFVNIKDTIYYKTLETNFDLSTNKLINKNFDLYNNYIEQNEPIKNSKNILDENNHNYSKFINLFNNFDINKIEKIKIFWCNINKCYFICNGIHRTSILTFLNYFPNNNIPKKYFEIIKMTIFDNKIKIIKSK